MPPPWPPSKYSIRDHARTIIANAAAPRTPSAFDHHGKSRKSRPIAILRRQLWKALGEKLISLTCRCDVRQMSPTGRSLLTCADPFDTRQRETVRFLVGKVGAGDRIRTDDFNLGKVALYP